MATTTAIKMYDLAGADPKRRFSPYCWRIRMALAHKHLTVETIPWRYCDKPAIAHSGQDRVPVIEDGDRVIADSWAIANYLEDAYPDRPSLFGGTAARAIARFINSWADTVQNGGISTFVASDIVRPSRPARPGLLPPVPGHALRHAAGAILRQSRRHESAAFAKPSNRCG